jgi:hypothetical protein
VFAVLPGAENRLSRVGGDEHPAHRPDVALPRPHQHRAAVRGDRVGDRVASSLAR